MYYRGYRQPSTKINPYVSWVVQDKGTGGGGFVPEVPGILIQRNGSAIIQRNGSFINLREAVVSALITKIGDYIITKAGDKILLKV